MKLSEIIAHNKANLERCTAKQADSMRNGLAVLFVTRMVKVIHTNQVRFISMYVPVYVGAKTTIVVVALFNSVLITAIAYVTDYNTFRRIMMILYVA